MHSQFRLEWAAGCCYGDCVWDKGRWTACEYARTLSCTLFSLPFLLGDSANVVIVVVLVTD